MNRNGHAGAKGGSGGLRGSFTVGKDSSITPCEGGRGGNRGDAHNGWTLKQEGKTDSYIRSNHRHGLAGEDAPDAVCKLNANIFGNGGGGGGGGGGGSQYHGFFIGSNAGDGGKGGTGATGGFGAGSGGGGGGGQNGDFNGKGGKSGERGSGGFSALITSEYGARGDNGEPSKFGTGLSEADGGRGGHGAALEERLQFFPNARLEPTT